LEAHFLAQTPRDKIFFVDLAGHIEEWGRGLVMRYEEIVSDHKCQYHMRAKNAPGAVKYPTENLPAH
jgi:hypothetical protein